MEAESRGLLTTSASSATVTLKIADSETLESTRADLFLESDGRSEREEL